MPKDGSARPRDRALGPTVARLCEALEEGDVIAIASTEQRGEAIARAAQSLTDHLVLWCPPSDALPGEGWAASASVAGQRMGALGSLHDRGGRHVLLVTDAPSASRKVAPPSAFANDPLEIGLGSEVDERLAEALEAIGYFQDDRVDEPGEFAIRGGAVDLFPADGSKPFRIHLEEGRAESITPYDPVTQLGEAQALERLLVRPAVEPPPGAGAVTILDHLAEARLAIDPEAEDRRERFLELAREGAKADTADLVGRQEWSGLLKGRARVALESAEVPGERFVELKRPDRAFLAALKSMRSAGQVVAIAGSARDLRFFARRIEQALAEAPRPVSHWRDVRQAEPRALLAIEADLGRGWSEAGLSVIATADVLGARAQEAGASAGAANPLMQDLADFHIGDAVIHEDHGLAILRGLETVQAEGAEGEAIRLEYASQAQRLVPVEEADRIWRYGSESEAVTLDRLDGSSWQRRRGDIDSAVAETARQLVALARERAARTAAPLEAPVADYERFVSGFPYEETHDQLRAIEAVRGDLASGRPMDRLVVGDVGYGKTEVALRAAAVAALAGKQVAVVAPTTVLVRQHIDTFEKRFARLGLKVAGLSRLSAPAEARAAKAGLADGSVRIVIGTGMVAGKGVAFKELGLVIIDEEQRFGAADKAKLRALAAEGHVLTLTATPIPRTLQTAMVGLQELSLITTPPARRLPTRSLVAPFSPQPVRSALVREKKRGGQSFVVVPRIEDIEPMAERLRALVPDLTLRVAHGKMPAAQIDDEMIRFSAGDGDILLATNIIEAGLDIPRANTMLIWRADRFGLSQLHQLRGRIGRGRTRGYLMLLTEPDARIAPATMKRLRTMEALDQLGAGFAISARDLDLRGAGELLGEEQSGHLKLIGLGLYQHLVEQAVRTARGEEIEAWDAELNLGLSGRIPESWIPEEEVRINLYARVARLASASEIDALRLELEDRFGTLPPEADRLLEIARIRRLAREAHVARVQAGPAAIALTPRRGFRHHAARAAGLEEKEGRMLLREPSEADEDRLDRVRGLLERLVEAES
jgi:transcription-repair coupling factor (superfamily II helicase)